MSLIARAWLFAAAVAVASVQRSLSGCGNGYGVVIWPGTDCSIDPQALRMKYADRVSRRRHLVDGAIQS